MTGKHRQPESPVRIASATAHPRARSTSRTNVVIGAISVSVATAGVLAGAAVQFLVPEDAPAPAGATVQPAPQAQPLSQQGTLIAVSADSVTARSASGFTQTYQVTPDTTALTPEGNQTVSPASTFAVNDQVAIVAVVQDGTAFATTVADRQVAGLDGPPMDSVAGQPASNVGAPTTP